MGAQEYERLAQPAEGAARDTQLEDAECGVAATGAATAAVWRRAGAGQQIRLGAAVVIALGLLAAAGVALRGMSPRSGPGARGGAGGPAVAVVGAGGAGTGAGTGSELLAMLETKRCHTAVPGEPCYEDVHWAITDGIYAHPEWYEGLTNESNFETFQAVVYKVNSTRCPLPCNYAPQHASGKNEHVSDVPASGRSQSGHLEMCTPACLQNEVEGGKKHRAVEKKPEKKETKDVDAQNACHTARHGDSCWKAVRWAMTDGIVQKPDWYEGLSKASSFEDFQANLHEKPETNCPKPCECHTAVEGEQCYDHILWVLKEGLRQHPEWYEGLQSSSRFEEVQERLHEDHNTTCQKPCTPRTFGSPSLFCFSVFQSKGYEPGLMKAQLEKRQGIFSCDEFAVICDAKLTLGQGPYGPVTALVIPHTHVGISKDNTAANTLIFIHAWQEIYNDFRFRHHDWTLKVDPDAVIVPDRLRTHLAPHTGKKVYVKNCNKYPGSPNWPMMFGSLEAISQSAIWAYMEHSHKCKNELEWEAWGEDLYLAECLDLLGCDNVHDYKIISDKVCLGVDCSDPWAAAFHAFKGTKEWFQCWREVFQ